MTSSSTHSTTTILDLNEDCLRSVFDFLNLSDLCDVADVCARFRDTAKAHVAKSKHCVADECPSFRTLRNFASSLTSIWIDGDFRKRRSKHQLRLMSLVNRHWSESITNLRLFKISINHRIASSMRSMLLRLETLSLEDCRWDDVHLQSLALDAPELRHLKFANFSCVPWIAKLHGLDQTFPKLQSISFQFDYCKHSEIKQFFFRNPQLKKIEIGECGDVEPGYPSSLIQSIAEYVPEVESIIFTPLFPRPRIGDYFFGRLRKLKVLRLVGYCGYLTSVLCHIVTTDIPLERLDLGLMFDLVQRQVDGLIYSISELKTLSTLKVLRVTNAGLLSHFDFIKICKSLSELSELHVDIYPALGFAPTIWSEDHLLELIENAEKLKVLNIRWIDSVQIDRIDADLFMKMVKVVERRPEKIHLTIILWSFNVKVDVPSALVRAHNASLKIRVES